MRRYSFLFLIVLLLMSACSGSFIQYKLLTKSVIQYEKAEFDIDISSTFTNPFDQDEVRLDMVLKTPSGKDLVLPCYFANDGDTSGWKARFTPQEKGTYHYAFNLTVGKKSVETSAASTFQSLASDKDGFLHTKDFWTLVFDSGKPFRGIGENVGWESRSFEDSKWTYDHLLPTLSNNGANFFRTWMCVWNLPVAWPKVNDTKRYTDSGGYFNESGIRRMDDLVNLSDSLGLYFMISIDAHGALMPEGQWKFNAHNNVNGGPASSPEEFFTNEASKAMYKNRLRYIVARWGYSPSIAAWEFFNEIDNATYTPTPHDSVLIAHSIITAWHDEMSTYLKSIDPYKHIVTTSVSHRDITGMNDLANIDLNQKHIYNKTHLISPTIHQYVARHNKPYVIGEFGYDWNWDNVTHDRGAGFDHDYKRGLWYGLFSPTPILPMTWWWEFFDERNMTPYFNGVREISDKMLSAGDGSFSNVNVLSGQFESYAVKCGKSCFVYLLNNTDASLKESVLLSDDINGNVRIEYFDPEDRSYQTKNIQVAGGKLSEITLTSKKEIVLIITSVGNDQDSGASAN